MKSHHFLAHCLSTPWAMDPSAMAVYASILARAYGRRDGVAFETGAQALAHESLVAAPSRSQGMRQGNIALIQVFGTIVQRSAQLGPCEGGTSTNDIGNALSAALADETVSQILMEFDTPGGSVFGVAELGDKIRAARGVKPIVGVANSMAASAGYWLMSQCGECYMTPGGQVGSIGVYTAHQDISKAMAEAGINMTLISAGKYKVEGNPFAPLDEEAAAFTQAGVEDYYTMFTGAVAKGRNAPVAAVRDGMGQGRCLGADAALAAGMVDGVMTFDQVAKKMMNSAKAARNGRSALAAARLELAMHG